MEQDEKVSMRNRTTVALEYFEFLHRYWQADQWANCSDETFRSMGIARRKRNENEMDKLIEENPFLEQIIDILNYREEGDEDVLE